MKKLEGFNSRIARLTELVGQLENGTLTVQELSEMELITRELHERSIILRYNAFKDAVEETQEVEGVEVEVIIEELEEEEPIKEEVSEPSAAEPMIDFSIFDDEDTASPEPELVTKQEVAPVVDTPELRFDAPETLSAQPEVEVEVETPAAKTDAASNSFLDQLKIEDNSVANQFAMGKIDSLIGAFGLNERLRFINDLFDGSSELFSDAIKLLDSQKSLEAANLKATDLAGEHSWDPEEESVIEFMTYLNRRYA